MSKHSQFHLFATRRFLPLFITQFFGAFNDLIFKTSIVMLITYAAADKFKMDTEIVITIAAGIFILPFFLFSATAGELADKYDKAILTRYIKLLEIVLMCLGAIGFYFESITWLLVVLFFMGAQSAFFGPIKYSILPDHLAEDDLIGANALIETGTFLSILTGTIIGGLLILIPNGRLIISVMCIFVAISGWISSLYIPKTKSAAPKLHIKVNFIKETWRIIQFSRTNRVVFLSIFGISWFWLIGSTFVAQFPNYVKLEIGGNEQIVTLFLTVFSLGIGIGSLLCNKILKGEIHATYVPLAAFGISIFIFDFYIASSYFTVQSTGLITIGTFLKSFTSWRILFDMLMLSIFAGIYVVPLFAILQSRSAIHYRSRTVACNNIINSLFMVISAVGAAFLFLLDFSVNQIFLVLAIANSIVAMYICKLIPDAALRSIMKWVLKLLYKVEIQGIENFRNAPEKLLIIANHTSFLDGLLLTSSVNQKLTFAINTQTTQQWWVKPLLVFINAFPIDPTNPMSTKSLIKLINQNKRVVIFPEGRITVTGALMKVYEGPGMIADKTGAHILPIYIEGSHYTIFSRLRGKVRIRLFPKIKIKFLKPRKFDMPEKVSGRERRRLASIKLYDLMSEMMFECSDYHKTTFQALIDAKKIHGGHRKILEDIDRKKITYNQLITKSHVLGNKISELAQDDKVVGMLLPNTSIAVITFFALQAYSYIPAILDSSSGISNILSACRISNIKQVYTSRLFVRLNKLKSVIEAIESTGITVIYLEELAKKLSIKDKVGGFLKYNLPFLKNKKIVYNPSEPAVILFTPGSKGSPKGIVLSHANIQANCRQITSQIDFVPSDVVLNTLPVFSSFGLICGTLLPILSGIKTFCYPTPFHYRIIPELAYDINATILFGTDTLLFNYAKAAHQYDFYSLRHVFASLQKLKPATRKIWTDKLGVRIFEGYSTTETTSFISANTPMHNKPNSVGRLLPSIRHKLVDVPGITQGKKLLVFGPNVMKGYLDPAQKGTILPTTSVWHDTNDIVTIDDEGYITIKDHISRFVPINGTTISLTSVEIYIAKLWPEYQHVVIPFTDKKQNQQLMLVTDHQEATYAKIKAYAKQHDIDKHNIPWEIKIVDNLPLLGSGKFDYIQIENLYTKPSI